MIYFTGDFHGEFARFAELAREVTLTEKDYLVICGDFGFFFYPRGTMQYVMQQGDLNEMETFPFTVLFVDGNHENFDLLEECPVEQWNGGRVHRVRKNVLHLMRGQVYDIDGVRVFSMGGAYSRDKYMRKAGYSWWHRELPDNAEYREATQNLAEVGNKVDVIVSHTAPRGVIYLMGKTPDPHDNELTGFFDWLRTEMTFDKWFFGHWHDNKLLQKKYQLLYDGVVAYQKAEE